MLDLGLALFLALIAAGIGKRLLESVGELPDHPLDALALATPLGLGLLALACLALGELGWLNLAGLAVLLAVATELGLLAGFRLVRDAVRGAAAERHGTPARPGGSIGSCSCSWLLTLGATALAALAPVTDGDALCYHLQVPKIFLIRQAVYFDPDLHETVYPLVTELLYAVALEFRGPVACRCLQWVLGLVFAANVAALARPTPGTPGLVGRDAGAARPGGQQRHVGSAQRRGPGRLRHGRDRGLDPDARPSLADLDPGGGASSAGWPWA